MRKLVSIAILSLLCLPLTASPTEVDVTILVLDGSDSARGGIQGATVALEGTGFAGTCDENGSIDLEAVPEGVYRLVVWADGFSEYRREIEIDLHNWSFEAELQPAE